MADRRDYEELILAAEQTGVTVTSARRHIYSTVLYCTVLYCTMQYCAVVPRREVNRAAQRVADVLKWRSLCVAEEKAEERRGEEKGTR